MPTEQSPSRPPVGRAAAPWGPPRLPSAGAAVNIVVAALVVLGAATVPLGMLRGEGFSGWLLAGGVLLLCFGLAQVVGELTLALCAPWSVRRAVAVVVGATGAAGALALLIQGHSDGSTCTDYCSTDVATGRLVEVVAVGVLAYTVLTAVRLVRRDERSRPLEAAVGVLAAVLLAGYVVFGLLLGTH